MAIDTLIVPTALEVREQLLICISMMAQPKLAALLFLMLSCILRGPHD